MSERPNYKVRAIRDGQWWFLEAPDVRGALSQSRRLDQADGMIRDALSLLLDVEPDSFDVGIEPELEGPIAAVVGEVESLREQQHLVGERLRNQQLRSDLMSLFIGKSPHTTRQRSGPCAALYRAGHPVIPTARRVDRGAVDLFGQPASGRPDQQVEQEMVVDDQRHR